MLLLGGCNPLDDPGRWANREEIIQAAEKCGVAEFKPTEVGGAWAAYVPLSVPDRAVKEQCIYDHFNKIGKLVTR